MIIVTGACRSGSSLVMQTLQLLDIPLAGEAHHVDFPVKEGNPKGYYDLPLYNLMVGIGSKYSDKAVKLFGTALPKIEYPETITHAIVCCRRDVEAQDKSTRNLIELELKAEIDTVAPLREMVIKHMEKMTDNDISSMRRKTYQQAYKYLEDHNINYIKVFYEDMLLQPLTEINRIIEHLKIKASDEQINEAKENVDV